MQTTSVEQLKILLHELKSELEGADITDRQSQSVLDCCVLLLEVLEGERNG